MVQLTDELVAQLDEEATRLGVSRSSLIRTAVEKLLTTSSEHAATERLVAAYRANPPSTPDAWGDLSQAADVATRETMQRLDAEEAAAGFAPW
jgi:Arc/MetJ-type ribon-helix-helix transcriptional regulator